MNQDELREVLRELANAVKGLTVRIETLESVIDQRLSDIQAVLATWDEDQKAREAVLSERIDRQRESTARLADRVAKLEP